MPTLFIAGIVCVLDASGNPAGTGFVVSASGLIATCAHVISESQPDRVLLVFHATQEQREATVLQEYWRTQTAEDIAILQLDGDLPQGVIPLPLGLATGTEDHEIRTFGFPDVGNINGEWGHGKVLGIVLEGKQGLLQLRSSEITEGFSGAPIWDESRRRVIGMVVKIATPDRHLRQTETAFAQPTEMLRVICPSLQVSEICPYQGLDIFTESQAEFFFGREHVIERLVNRLKQDIRFLAVMGPSGSGKSSLVQAGLIPRLRYGAIGDSDRWGVIVIRPADNPFAQLALQGLVVESQNLKERVEAWFMSHQDPKLTRLVLIIDQFEELLTTCHEMLREEFITQLANLLKAPLLITVVLIMRNDFYNQFVQQEALVDWLERSQGPVNIPEKLIESEVVTIVRKPAEIVGLRFEEGLIETIIEDVMGAPTFSTDRGQRVHSTVLPLLEFALTQLWQRRVDGVLTRNAYHAIGGVTGGLTQWADQVFYSLGSEEKQKKARRLLADLVYIGDESQRPLDSRRQVSLISLCRNKDEMDEIHLMVQQLASSRLLVTAYDIQNKQEIVEIIHDALLWEWGQLRQWLEEDRSFLVWHQELRKRVQTWVETNIDDPGRRDKYKLFGGSDLLEATRWLNERATDLSPLERNFIQASLEQQKRDSRRRFLSIGLVGLALLTTAGSGIVLLTRPSGLQISPSPTATPSTQKIPLLIFTGHSNSVNTAVWSPDGRHIASASDDDDENKRVLLWDATTRKIILIYPHHTREVKNLAWSPDGRRIASASHDRTAQVWDAITGKTLLIYQKHSDNVRDVTWSPDGKLIASASYDATVQIWDATTGKTFLTYKGHSDLVFGVAWSPDGKYIASCDNDGMVAIWDPTDPASAANGYGIYFYYGHSRKYTVKHVEWSPDSRRIASASYDGTVQVWDATTGANNYIYRGHSDAVYGVSWAPDGKHLASASADHTVQVWDAATGNILKIYTGHSNTVNNVWWSPDGKYLASASDDTKVLIWQAL